MMRKKVPFLYSAHTILHFLHYSSDPEVEVLLKIKIEIEKKLIKFIENENYITRNINPIPEKLGCLAKPELNVRIS